MTLRGLHHVALIGRDYAATRRFYVDVLGLPVVAETHRAARDSWKLDLALPDGARLEVFSFPDPPPRRSRPEAAGLRHLAFAVDDLDAAVTHLAAHGVASEAIRLDGRTGRRFTFCADPDGLPVEFVEAAPRRSVPPRDAFPDTAEFYVKEFDVPLVRYGDGRWDNWFGGAPRAYDVAALRVDNHWPAASFDEWAGVVAGSLPTDR